MTGGSGWVDVGPLDDLPVGGPTLARVGGRRLVLVRLGGPGPPAVVAADDACPHAGDPLSLGFCADSRLVCRSHGFAFDLADGACVAGDRGARLKLHETRVEDGRVLVRLRA